MDVTIHDFYDAQIKPLSDDEKRRLVELIAHELASGNGGHPAHQPLNSAQRQAARERFRRHAGELSLGYSTGADNERIDADLAREYGARSESN